MKLRTVGRISMICAVIVIAFGFLYFVSKRLVFGYIAISVCTAGFILVKIISRCPYYGRYLRGSRYCPHCGSKLDWK